MANHQVPNDPMAKKVLYGVGALLLFTVLILLYFLLSTISKNTTEGEIVAEGKTENLKAVANFKAAKVRDQLMPIGTVKTGKKVAGGGSAGPRSGEDVYTAVCTACHSTGAAGAPKLDDKANWETRVATGLEALIASVTNGKGAMPARAGNPSLKDAEIHNGIIYMTSQAGFNLGEEKSGEEEKKAEEGSDAKTDDATQAKESGDSKETSANTKAEATEESVEVPAKPAAPATPETPATPNTPSTPAAPAAPAKQEATDAEQTKSSAEGTQTAKTEKTGAESATDTLAHGKSIYDKTCFTCHATGAANSPKLDDKANWEPRLAQGKEALYTSALKGKVGKAGVMPPKGGHMYLSDDDVKAAVDYMAEQTK